MSVVATGFERSTTPRRAVRAKGARRVLRGLLAAFDRLVPPPSDIPRDAGLPAEWFKYPPF
jgi:hypothetical protein